MKEKKALLLYKYRLQEFPNGRSRWRREPCQTSKMEYFVKIING